MLFGMLASGQITASDVRTMIEETADDKGTTGRDDYYGWGRINAYRTLSKANGPPTAPVLSLSGLSGDNPTLSWVDGGEPDLNHFVLKKKYTNDTGTMTYYIDPVPNPYTYTGIVIKKRGGTLAEYWVKSVDEADQESPYSNKESVYGLGPAFKQVGSEQTIPEGYRLAENFPNPFNPTTTIRFDLPERSRVNMVIYDVLGRTIKTLIQNTIEPGFHEIQWNGKDDKGNPVSTGMYVYRFSAFSEESNKTV